MMMREDFKDINNSLKKICKNSGKQVDALKQEKQKSLKVLQESTNKKVKQLNKAIHYLKMELEKLIIMCISGARKLGKRL